ncbi:MAG: hypothetical protein M3340_11375 [Actinomycetota bacterium]|nr:hypothetical protein [Actinomycetota bacterium]
MSPGFGTEMSGTHMSPGAVFSTEMSPGFGTEMSGTHMSPGAVFSTEISPGFGTEMSGTHISPGTTFIEGGQVGVTFDALVDFAHQVRASGALNVDALEKVGRIGR